MKKQSKKAIKTIGSLDVFADILLYVQWSAMIGGGPMRRRRTILTGICLLAGLMGIAGASVDSRAAKPKTIKVSQKKATIEVGDKYKISYKVNPKKAKNKKVTFTSSKKKVATVTSKGVVKAKKEGTTTITLRSKKNKKVKTKVKITVEKAVKTSSPVTDDGKISVIGWVNAGVSQVIAPTGMTMLESLDLAPGERYQMEVLFVPATATAKITWACDFKGGINVYQDGSIYVTDDTPEGTTATIIANCGALQAKCKITVTGTGCIHEWNDGVITTPAECLKDGLMTYTCSKCLRTKTEAIDATGHEWDTGRVLKEPNCTDAGLRQRTCIDCRALRDEDIPATGHKWGVGTILEEATCTSKGKKEHICTECEAVKTETINAKGHTWDAGEITKEPGCTTAGLTTYHCTVLDCIATKSSKIPANGHTYNYGEITKEPTCTGKGQRVSECLICNSKMNVYVDALGHEWDAGVITKEPGCSKTGVRTYTCKVCWEQRTEKVDSLGHEFGEFVIDKKPTCTLDGSKSKYCVRCGLQAYVNAIDATGHKMDGGTTTKEPTCTTSGTQLKVCTNEGCEFKSYTVLKALGHAWEDNFTIDEEATCTKNGMKSYHCSRCAATRWSAVVPALGHDFSVPVVAESATCAEEGIMHYDCQRAGCMSWKEEIIPPVGHKWEEEFTTDIEPICDVAGSESKHCEVCDEKTEITAIPALGHSWSDWSDTKQAGCVTAGERKRTCSVCDKVQNMGVVPHGHSRNDEGTCMTCGDTITYEDSELADWNYTLDDTNKIITLRFYKGSKTHLSIPATFDITKDGVTTTYTVAFKKCEGRESSGVFTSNMKKCDVVAVEFADDIELTDISYLFYNCPQLQEVNGIPDTVTNMEGTFKGCEKLLYVNGGLPNGIEALSNTFENCLSLQAIPKIPDSVTNLYATFKGATGLTAAPTIPAGVTTMSWTFSGCTSLHIPPELPSSLVDMTNTFEGCTSLVEVPVVTPLGVKMMIMTYYGCTSLTMAPAIPNTVEVMEYTFKNCTNLTYAVKLPSTIEQLDVYGGCDKLTIAEEKEEEEGTDTETE